jgi:ribosomal protein S18 acetylase RimI-like enzyme
MIVAAAFPPGRAPAFAEAVRAPHVVAVARGMEHRGQGIGTALLEPLVSAARAAGVRATSLSVGRSNPALRRYGRMGFERHADVPLRLLRRL